jgi:hypothetical protein
MTASDPDRRDEAKPAAPVPKLPFVLLGLMSLLTFAGPFAILLTIRGGRRPEWPPDRPVEWWVFGLVTAAVVVLMGACVTVGLWARPRKKT